MGEFRKKLNLIKRQLNGDNIDSNVSIKKSIRLNCLWYLFPEEKYTAIPQEEYIIMFTINRQIKSKIV